MNTALQRTIERLERQKATVIRRIEAWPAEWLTYKPAPSEWSVLQVLDHLHKTELSALKSCRLNLESREHRVTASERARAAALLVMMRMPVKVKVPEGASFVLPDDTASLRLLLSSWSAERLELKAFLGTCAASDETAGVLFHPAAGWMNLRAAVSFLSAHLRHHEYQLERIERACRSAAI